MTELFDGPSLEASLDDLKVIFRVLTRHVTDHPEIERNAFFLSLARLLETQAAAEGVDLDDPDAWEAWLHEVDEEEPHSPSHDLLN